MENEKVIQQLKDIEHELRGYLQANAGIDPKVLASYRDLLHKTRLERLSIQVESISASGKKPANVLVNMKKDGEVEVTPCGHGDVKVKPGLFNVSSDTLKKNIDAVQKSLAEKIVKDSLQPIKKKTRKR